MDLLVHRLRSLRVPIVLACILLTGIALRIAYLSEIRSAPFFSSPAVDAGFHDYWARGIVTGDWSPPSDSVDPEIYRRPFFRPPGYPYFLAAIYGVFDDGYLAPRVAHSVLGLSNVLLAFAFARRWFGPAEGLLTAAMMATYWIFIYFEGELHAPSLLIFLMLIALNLFGLWRVHSGLGLSIAAGVACGLAALVRPNALVLFAASVLWMSWVVRRRRPTAGGWISILAAVLGAALAISPVTLRNYRVSGEIVPISSNLGINLFIGNNERADGLVATDIEQLGTFRTCFDWPPLVERLERRLGRDLTDSQVSRYFVGESLSFIRRNPARFLGLSARKAALFWGPAEVGHNKEVFFERRNSSVLRRLPGSFPALLAIAIVGCSLLVIEHSRPSGGGVTGERRRWDMTILVLGWITAYFMSVVPFFAAARYRVPILPLLMLFASVAVVRLARDLRSRDWRVALLIGLAVTGLYVLTTRSYTDYEPSLARWYFDRGTDFDRVGDPSRAERDYARAVEVRPDFFEARYNLGHKLADRDRLDEAIEQWRLAEQLYPEFAPVHSNLARALSRSGRRQAAIEELARAIALEPESAVYRVEQGDLLAATGRIDAAIEQYEAAISIRGTHVAALRNLSLLLSVHPDPDRRDPPRAVALAERAADLTDERSPSVLDALAAAYAAAGRDEESARTFRRAYALAREAGQDGLAERIRRRAESYSRGEKR